MELIQQLIDAGDIRLRVVNDFVQRRQTYILQFNPNLDFYWLHRCAQDTGMDFDVKNHGLILLALSFSPSVVGGESHAW